MTEFEDFDLDNIDLNNLNLEYKEKSNNTTKFEYDERTTEYYKTLRKLKLDPITCEELDNKVHFEFKYKWDPYTGERGEQDPDGPLCFDADTLIKYYHIHRLRDLWVEPKQEMYGLYQGYYDYLVGAAVLKDNKVEINIEGRGNCPEKYLFRLPIIDCYLPKGHNNNIITMGPILTDSEIKEINEIANMNKNNYKINYKSTRPSIIEMKKAYDQAINKNPIINYKYEKNLTEQEIRTRENHVNVAILKML